MKINFLENEYWWGGVTHHGRYMPINEKASYLVDLATTTAGNQSAPFFVSNKGRYIWCDKPFKIAFKNGHIIVDDFVSLSYAHSCSLRAAYCEASSNYFPFSGDVPEKEFFVKPQYNTWAELTYNQNQQSVLAYAKAVIENGYTPGVIMIDDTWQLDYGMWEFEYRRFPEPKKMVDELHGLGFKVMLWVVPFISPDSPAFREARSKPDRLLRDSTGEPMLVKWWNGYSAVLDMNKNGDKAWMKAQLDGLQQKYGIDGFKFDGGNFEELNGLIDNVDKKISIGRSWHLFGGEEYPYHEIKDSFNLGGKPFIERLRDKYHCWGKEGLADLIPDALNLSITGHPFICPDMVGGGEWTCFVEGASFDEELIVRFAECSALFPMLQFSVAPWRILSGENQKYVLRAEQLHIKMGEEIYNLAKEAAKTGEPIMRPLDYNFPNCGYETVTDQFMLGDNILVAPVLKKGAVNRRVIFPKGKWQNENGEIIEGPTEIVIDAPLGVLPYYKKKDT